MGMAECDDGNGKSGDGCSPNCKIEKGWSCDINANKMDICKNIAPITLKSFKIQKGLKFTIIFSKNILVSNYNNSININLKKANSSRVIKADNITIFTTNNHSKLIKGNFTIDSSVDIGDVNKLISHLN